MCLDPATNGHVDRWAQRSAGSRDLGIVDGKMTEEAKAERRVVIDNNKAWVAAEPVRLGYVRDLLGRRTAPKGTVALLAVEIITHPESLDRGSDERLADLLRVTRPQGWGRRTGPVVLADNTEARLPVLMLAQVAAAHEDVMGKHTWRQSYPDAARWLRFLATTGYTLSDIEQLVVDQAEGTAWLTDVNTGDDHTEGEQD